MKGAQSDLFVLLFDLLGCLIQGGIRRVMVERGKKYLFFFPYFNTKYRTE